MVILSDEGFTNDPISSLGREQEHRQENLEHELSALKTTKNVLEGAALGSIPGMVIVTVMALTGDVGLPAAGPLVAAMSALGFGALGGSLIGAGWSALDTDSSLMNVGEKKVEEVQEDAISQGKWVIIAHSYHEAEAMLHDAHRLIVSGAHGM